jgi:sarcosine oxidase subunit gamma
MSEWFAKSAAQAALTDVPEGRRWVLRGGDAALVAAGAAFGASLPAQAGGVARVAGTPRAALWLGPDEIWLGTSMDDGAALEAALQTGLAAHAHSLVDISHRNVALELSGTHAAWLLNSLCPLELTLEAFPVDTVTRTLFSKAEIVLWRTGEHSFQLVLGRSFRGYVAGLLAEVSRELAAA